MTKPCTKCGKSPNIKVNVLNYCKDCFVHSFEKRVFRNITRVTPASRVFVFLEDHVSATAMHLLRRYFEDRHVSRVEVLSRNDVIPEEGMFSASSRTFGAHSLQDFQGRRGLEFCTNNQFDVLMYAEPLEDAVCRSMELLCAGMGMEAAKSCSFESTSIVNVFGGIRNKEIAYYAYLGGIRRTGPSRKGSRLQETLHTFLSDIDSKNGLALFNIMGTLRKLG